MKRLAFLAIIAPVLNWADISPPININVQLVKVNEIPGLYLLKWYGTYWAQLEVLEYCEDGDVESNQVNEKEVTE
jgi:hypothetical protein